MGSLRLPPPFRGHGKTCLHGFRNERLGGTSRLLGLGARRSGDFHRRRAALRSRSADDTLL